MLPDEFSQTIEPFGSEGGERILSHPPVIGYLVKHAEKDILKLIPAPAKAPARTRLRIGIHTSTAGGVENAAERAYRLGCNTFQVFSSSPRQWKPFELSRPQCDTMSALRREYDLSPFVVHANYLINLAGTTAEFHRKSVEAFRGEVMRCMALCADFLVLHPGSFRGGTRKEGLARVAEAIGEAVGGLDLEGSHLKITIENTAGAEYSLGGSFEQVAELMEEVRGIAPVAACIDTCHTHVAGCDITTREGFQQTMRQIDSTIGLKHVAVWHCNDAKAPRGSKLDRHEHIGRGNIGLEPFGWLLNDPRVAHAAFIAETPIDEPLDDQRNVRTLMDLVEPAANRED